MAIWDKLINLSRRLAAGEMPRVHVTTLNPGTSGTQPIKPNEAYFGITIDRINLADGREWFSLYDPLAYVSVDFEYAGERISVPKLIGPSTMRAKLPGELPHGFLVKDIRVAGPSPYRGGQLGITVILFKIRTTDYAKRVLQIAETLSETVGLTTVSTIAKMAGSISDSVEAVLGMQDTVAVLGHRSELRADPSAVLIPGRFVVGVDVRTQTLNWTGERLISAGEEEFVDGDFIAYSVWGAQFRESEQSLPFYRNVKKMYDAASSGDDAGWARAKAMLVSLYDELLDSADLTETDAERLFCKYRDQLVKRHEVHLKSSMMGDGTGSMGEPRSREEARLGRLDSRAKEILALS